MLTALLALIGFLLSLYALNVYLRARSKKYKPLCDVRENVSCKQAFIHKYGKRFRVHNSIIGIIYYLLIIVLIGFEQRTALIALATLALLDTMRLAYLSYWKMRNFCVICTAVYVVNVLIFLTVIF